MKALTGIVSGIQTVTKYLKLFECIAAGLEAFTAKAKELNLISDAATNSTNDTK